MVSPCRDSARWTPAPVGAKPWPREQEQGQRLAPFSLGGAPGVLCPASPTCHAVCGYTRNAATQDIRPSGLEQNWVIVASERLGSDTGDPVLPPGPLAGGGSEWVPVLRSGIRWWWWRGCGARGPGTGHRPPVLLWRSLHGPLGSEDSVTAKPTRADPRTVTAGRTGAEGRQPDCRTAWGNGGTGLLALFFGHCDVTATPARVKAHGTTLWLSLRERTTPRRAADTPSWQRHGKPGRNSFSSWQALPRRMPLAERRAPRSGPWTPRAPGILTL